jgi:hypothetical protein
MALGLLPWIELRFFLEDGVTPNAFGSIITYAAGTTTPQVTYADAGGVTSNPTTITLDSGGRPSLNVFLGTASYDIAVLDASDVTLYTMPGVTNAGVNASDTFGVQFSAGAKNQASGYTVVSTDRLVTMATSSSTTNPAVINLCAASAFTSRLTIKNLGTYTLAVTPSGTDTIEGANAALNLIPASGVAMQYPTVVLLSDGVSKWAIESMTPSW